MATDDPFKKICLMCNTPVHMSSISFHVPQCFRKFCHENGSIPACTCDECEGVKTHEGSRIRNKRKSPESPQEIPTNNSQAQPTSSGTPVSPSLPKTLKHLTNPANILMAKDCAVCGNRRSSNAVSLPLICIGKYRKIMICKKVHLTDPEESTALADFIDKTVNDITGNDAKLKRAALEDSDTEDADIVQ
jgi:hypothetical protein